MIGVIWITAGPHFSQVVKFSYDEMHAIWLFCCMLLLSAPMALSRWRRRFLNTGFLSIFLLGKTQLMVWCANWIFCIHLTGRVFHLLHLLLPLFTASPSFFWFWLQKDDVVLLFSAFPRNPQAITLQLHTRWHQLKAMLKNCVCDVKSATPIRHRTKTISSPLRFIDSVTHTVDEKLLEIN